jgi:hypothetical protein
MARDLPAPVITLTDGPLELFWEPNPPPEFEHGFSEYLAVLETLASLGATTAGYVDKPGSRLLVNLLEIALLPENELGSAGKRHPLVGLTDAALLSAILCNPGDRSALFGIRSIPADKFGGELALHFFYLNVGAPGSPNLVRVEVPAWVARSPQQLDALQAVLVAQCRSLGARP